MEKMQEYIDFIFYKVWCRAPKTGSFKLDLFNGNSEIKKVMIEFKKKRTDGGKFFYEHVNNIYNHFAKLSVAQIEEFKKWYKANNDIENACNDPDSPIIRYVDIMKVNERLGKQLASFFKNLYSQQLLGLVILKETIGDIDSHYQLFMQSNSNCKCPFCGIGDVKGVYHTKREAYDHYLPKGTYPFNSMNFHNLAPACHECNSTYKLTNDPVNSAVKGRRRAFYPYATDTYSIIIKISLKKSDIDRLTPRDINIEFGPQELMDKISTWKDVYGIEERYKAKCCSNTDGKEWLTQVIDEWQKDNRSPEDFMKSLTRRTDRSPFADNNFLKKAFLEGCQRAGLFKKPSL